MLIMRLKSSNKAIVGLLQYSKSVWTKVGTLTVYIDIE
jgi:hypothetical protein